MASNKLISNSISGNSVVTNLNKILLSDLIIKYNKDTTITFEKNIKDNFTSSISQNSSLDNDFTIVYNIHRFDSTLTISNMTIISNKTGDQCFLEHVVYRESQDRDSVLGFPNKYIYLIRTSNGLFKNNSTFATLDTNNDIREITFYL